MPRKIHLIYEETENINYDEIKSRTHNTVISGMIKQLVLHDFLLQATPKLEEFAVIFISKHFQTWQNYNWYNKKYQGAIFFLYIFPCTTLVLSAHGDMQYSSTFEGEVVISLRLPWTPGICK